MNIKMNTGRNIEILRLSHRASRDIRVSTHCCLVARAFNASRIYYSGNPDNGLEKSINKINKKWGSDFEITYAINPLNLIEQKKQEKFLIIHLTMYGLELEKFMANLKKARMHKNLLIIIGSEKVPPEIYKTADYNVSVSNQPHSEIAALAIILYELNSRKFRKIKGRLSITPSNNKKIIKNSSIS